MHYWVSKFAMRYIQDEQRPTNDIQQKPNNSHYCTMCRKEQAEKQNATDECRYCGEGKYPANPLGDWIDIPPTTTKHCGVDIDLHGIVCQRVCDIAGTGVVVGESVDYLNRCCVPFGDRVYETYRCCISLHDRIVDEVNLHYAHPLGLGFG